MWQAHATEVLPEVVDVVEYGVALHAVEADGRDAKARGVDLGPVSVVEGLYMEEVVQLDPELIEDRDRHRPLPERVLAVEQPDDRAKRYLGEADPHEVVADLAVAKLPLGALEALVRDAAVYALEHDLLEDDVGVEPQPPGLIIAHRTFHAGDVSVRPQIVAAPERWGRDDPF
ncbi:hypothetical protein QWA68_015803 [Fusarium oxysporum]|nr:hypothetical protein QWA68_015803 [Fusarium oxysporum]